MELILGIDLGTTNSVVSVIKDGRPVSLKDELGRQLIPSVVGLDADGRLLVGNEARNQLLFAPQRTVKSIKRRMGEDVKIVLGESEYSPQEISAIILRSLRQLAERALGQSVSKAVITVPAFFNDSQRTATREAGELAGLEVMRIINEPTAAALTYEPSSDARERLLVYDLGGGTFDVSIVQVESGVVEVLASCGDTHLGGDDFDQLLLDYLCNDFHAQHGVDLRTVPAARSRMLQAAEEAKKRLSFEAFTPVFEEFIYEKDGKPLHFDKEIDRGTYEELIGPLLQKTLASVDSALADSKLSAQQLDRVVLVGGSTRTPLVQKLLQEQLGHEPRWDVDPDLCVSLGAAVQGGLIAGIDVGSILVDITPHTLGVQCVGAVDGRSSEYCFSPIISKNTPLPATRSEIFYTYVNGQKAAHIEVFQGEHRDCRFNHPVGDFHFEGLDKEAEEGSEILVRFALNLDGILTVTAVERATKREGQTRIENAITRFRARDSADARAKLSRLFETSLGHESPPPASNFLDSQTIPEPHFLRIGEMAERAKRLLSRVDATDAEEIRTLLNNIESASSAGEWDRVRELQAKMDDLMFYLDEAKN